jgi:3-hydroxybutyrate dehydrogenase
VQKVNAISNEEKKSVLITGAGSGIGRGLAQRLAAVGFRIIATDLNETSAQETVDLILATGGEAVGFQVDIAKQTDIEQLFKSPLCQKIDLLINNAGLQHVAKLEEFPQEKWDLMLKVMLNGACMMTREVLPRMRKNSFGRIVNIGSIHSLVASPYKSAYVAAKHGLLGFSKVVALETADTDITINTICPSYVKTPLVDKQIDSQAKEHGISREQVINEIMLNPMPKGKFISIEELSGIVEFLVSDSAKNITGQTITVDGGWTIK